MGKVFVNKQFSSYLGENRAILDNVVSYTSDIIPSPTPSGTSSVTPTPTPTGTIPPSSPTTTPTPTITPSSTPNIPLTDMLYRFDASSASNLVLRNSGGIDYVEEWLDGSPLQNDVLQNDTAKQPIYQSDGFGSYEVLFDGTDDFLQNASITNIASGITALTEFMVFRIDDYTKDARIDSTNGDSDSYYRNTESRFFPLYYPGVYFQPMSGWTLEPNFFVVSRKGTTSGSMTGELNDQTYTARVFDTWSPEPAITNITLGRDSVGTEFFTGALREVIVYRRLLSDLEVSDVTSYLKTKWNYSAW
jgi:hypothetical protein